MSYIKNPSSGFTLIELMISLVIGTIVIGTGFSLYLQTSASRGLLQAELALQENSYYIDQTLRQLISQAGHRPLVASLLSTPMLPIQFTYQAFNKVNESASTDEASGNWDTGQYLRLEDNGIAMRFNGSSDDTGGADGTLIDCQGAPVAEGDTVVLSLTVIDGKLLCSSDGNSVELITNADGVTIERISVLWGVDSNNDRNVDEYRSTTENLATDETLLLVRVSMLLSSNDNVITSSSDYTFNGVEYTSLDSKLRREVVTTVQIKN